MHILSDEYSPLQRTLGERQVILAQGTDEFNTNKSAHTSVAGTYPLNVIATNIHCTPQIHRSTTYLRRLHAKCT